MAGSRKKHHVEADTEELIDDNTAPPDDPFAVALEAGAEEKPQAHGSLLVRSEHVPVKSEVPLLAGDVKTGASKALDLMFGNAAAHKERPAGRSAFTHKGRTIHMDDDVLAVPNSLYIGRNPDTGETWEHREQADQMLVAFFGPFETRAFALGARLGFVQKPLVAIAQQLHYQLTTCDDEAIRQIGLSAPEALFEGCGEGFSVPTGNFQRCLKLTFSKLSIGPLVDKAKYADIPVLFLLRCLIWDMCEKLKIRDPGPVERPEAIVS